MAEQNHRLGTGYQLPDGLGSVRGVHRQPRFAGGAIVTEHGTLRSDDFTAGSAGWSIDGDGNVEFNSGTFRGSITAGSVVTGGITVAPGGSMSSSNYVADTSGWQVTGTGDAEFNSVKVRGQITSGGALQSSNYSAGSAGWQIAGNGSAEFNDVTVRGDVIATSFTTQTTGAGWVSIGSAPSGGPTAAIFLYQGSVPVAKLYGVGSGGAVLTETDSSGVGTGGFLNLDTGDATLQAPNSASIRATAGNVNVSALAGTVGLFGPVAADNNLTAAGVITGGAVHTPALETTTPGTMMVGQSPDGTRWRFTITNAGAFSASLA